MIGIVQLMRKSPVSITAMCRSLPKKQRTVPATKNSNAFHIPMLWAIHPPAIFPNIDTPPNTKMSIAPFVTPVVNASPAKERPATISMMRRRRNTPVTFPEMKESLPYLFVSS